MDRFIDVPMGSISQEDVTAKHYTSSASVSHIYTGDMAALNAKIIHEPATSDINKIN